MSATSQSIVTFWYGLLRGMFARFRRDRRLDARIFDGSNSRSKVLLFSERFRPFLSALTRIQEEEKSPLIDVQFSRAACARILVGVGLCRNGLNSSKLCLSFDVTFLRLATERTTNVNTRSSNLEL